MKSSRFTLDRWAPLLVEISLYCLMLGIPAALGGVHRPTILAASFLSWIPLLLLWYYRRQKKERLKMPWFGVALLLATAFTALQMLPLPLSLLRLIAPATVEVLEVSLSGAGGVPAWHAISLDPYATLWETMKIGAAAATFLLAHNFLNHRTRRIRLLVALVIGGVILTFLGFVGAVVAPGKPLMLYTPEAGRAAGLITTSFVNPNHGSAYLILCTIVAVGLTVATRDLQKRVLLALASILLGSGTFLLLSRGGISALAVAFAALAFFLIFQQSSTDKRQRMVKAIVPGALALILGLSAWLAYEEIITEFRQTIPTGSLDLGKVALWPAGLQMIKANLWAGVGRGAFLTTFPRYLSGDLLLGVTYSHLENQYLHLPAEWGILVGGGLILASIIAFITWMRRANRGPRVAAVGAGMVAVCCHNLVDFNLEVLGIALPMAILAGLISARANRPHRSRSHKRPSKEQGPSTPGASSELENKSKSTRSLPGASSELENKSKSTRSFSFLVPAAIGLLVLTSWSAIAYTPDADSDANTINRLLQDKASFPEIQAAIETVIRRHPADYLPHLTFGQYLNRNKKDESLACFNRATFLYPKSPVIHLETAKVLRRLHRRHQALLEYRLALENGAESIRGILDNTLVLCRNYDEVNMLLPPAQPKFHPIAVASLIAAKRIDLARSVALAARNRWPEEQGAMIAEIEVFLAAQNSEDAIIAAHKLTRLHPSPDAFHLWAKATAQAGPPGAEIPVLKQGQSMFPKDISFLFALSEAHLRAKQFEQARKLVDEILNQATAPSTIAAAHDLLARIYNSDGRPHRARYEIEQAQKIRAGR